MAQSHHSVISNPAKRPGGQAVVASNIRQEVTPEIRPQHHQSTNQQDQPWSKWVGREGTLKSQVSTPKNLLDIDYQGQWLSQGGALLHACEAQPDMMTQASSLPMMKWTCKSLIGKKLVNWKLNHIMALVEAKQRWSKFLANQGSEAKTGEHKWQQLRVSYESVKLVVDTPQYL